MSARQAAAHLGVNEKTIRRWIDRGELPATKNAAGAYRINVADLDRHRADTAAPVEPHPAAPAADSAADMAAPTMPQAAPSAAPVDLSPLVDHIASLETRVQQLTEAATVWQIRAVQAEEKLKQLTAGDDEPQPRTEPLVASPAAQGEEIAPKSTPDTSRSETTDQPRRWWEFWKD